MFPSIQTVHLKRFYTKRRSRREKEVIKALDDVSLEVHPGELFGLLGPNGAGKTTLIKILTTLLLPSEGQAFVDGLDVVKQADLIRHRINLVSGGEHAGYGILTVRETLWMFSQFYGIPYAVARKRIDELLALVELKEEEKTRVNRLSTGMRQKLNFARGFINDPKIVFLDEPTLGLDVTSALACRKFIKRWIGEHPEKTVLLTTHYMTEADELCDRIAIISHGKILSCDTPANFKKSIQKEVLFEIEAFTPDAVVDQLSEIGGVLRVSSHRQPQSCNTLLRLSLQEDAVIVRVLERISAVGGQIRYLRKTEPTLEDVFVSIVGRTFEEDESTREA